jgi:hypothetical protein
MYLTLQTKGPVLRYLGDSPGSLRYILWPRQGIRNPWGRNLLKRKEHSPPRAALYGVLWLGGRKTSLSTASEILSDNSIGSEES